MTVVLPIRKKDRLDRVKSLESEIEWLTRDRDETKAELEEQEKTLAARIAELELLGCEYLTEDGLPCREADGRRGRVVEVVNNLACCEVHAQARRYSVGVA